MVFRNYTTFTPIRRPKLSSDSSASNLLISDMSVSSVTWQYRFIVILTLECPKITCTVFGFMPRSIHLVANVCLSVCGVNGLKFSCSSAIRSQMIFITRSVSFWLTGAFLVVTNTKSLNSSDAFLPLASISAFQSFCLFRI